MRVSISGGQGGLASPHEAPGAASKSKAYATLRRPTRADKTRDQAEAFSTPPAGYPEATWELYRAAVSHPSGRTAHNSQRPGENFPLAPPIGNTELRRKAGGSGPPGGGVSPPRSRPPICTLAVALLYKDRQSGCERRPSLSGLRGETVTVRLAKGCYRHCQAARGDRHSQAGEEGSSPSGHGYEALF